MTDPDTITDNLVIVIDAKPSYGDIVDTAPGRDDFRYTSARLHSTVSNMSDCRSWGCKFESQLSHVIFMEIDCETISIIILPFPLKYGRAVVSY